MIIKELILSSFGKFKGKKLILNEGLNIIYGENESGKTTVHKFIEGMFFGFFKPYSKRRTYTEEYEKYFPMNQNEYYGILKYEYNGQIYRVERKFIKENSELKVFDDKTGENITHLFEYDSVSRLHNPASIHMNLNRIVFNNTISVGQLNSKTDKQLVKEVKDNLINLGGSFDEDISVKRVLEKLDKQINDIGTEKRVKTSPYGKILDEIAILQDEKRNTILVLNEIEEYIELDKNEKNSDYIEVKKTMQEIDELEKEIELLSKYNNVSIEEYTEIMKLNNVIESLREKKSYLLTKQSELDQELRNLTDYSKDIDYIEMEKIKLKRLRIVSLVMAVTSLGLGIINWKISLIGILFIIPIIYSLKNEKEIDSKERKINKYIIDIENRKNEVNTELKGLEVENKEYILAKNKLKDIDEIKEALNKKEKYNNLISKLDSKKLILKNMKENRNIRLEEKTKNLEQNTKHLLYIEEEINKKEAEKEKYEEELNALKLAKDTIEDVSRSIQRDFSPKLNHIVSNILSSITNNKYTDVKIDEELDIKIVDTKERLVGIDNLSGGTIEQIYIATRLGINEVINGDEKLPLILDDAFIQYDENRLKNILNFLHRESLNRQIIIFTCQKREKEIIDKLSLNHSFIEI